ncbi:MAG: hypothetical protein M3R45_09690 [Pseudomonadota bacterium]|nr:hypothetical protein [Pseudomonadota bacterium]
MGSQCNKHLHLLIGIAVTAMAMPFGLLAAALATTFSSVGLAAWQHYAGKASPHAENMALALAGGAVYLLWAKALLPTVWG